MKEEEERKGEKQTDVLCHIKSPLTSVRLK